MLAVGTVLVSAGAIADDALREEAHEHPRLARAIHELEDAIHCLAAAPHDSGRFKAQALAESPAAVISLRRARADHGAEDENRR
jgi:hypothetical protein